MATLITEDCITCNACEDECPTLAISLDEVNDIFVIDPKRCTECVGFNDEPACQEACPVECCIPDPDIRETQEVLRERAGHIAAELEAKTGT